MKFVWDMVKLKNINLLKNLDSTDIGIIIGPEGGFSFKENEHFSSFCQNISLSKTILRAEVASVVAVSTLKAVSV